MFNPQPNASLVTITYHYYPSGNPPSNAAPPSSSSFASATSFTSNPSSVPTPAPGKPNPAFFQYLAHLARSYQSHSKSSFFHSSKPSAAETRELESTFREAVQSVLFTSPSLLGSDWATRELILRTLYLCKQLGLDAGQVRKASHQVLTEWYEELQKSVKAVEKRREGLKAKREELETLRAWTRSYAGSGWSGDPYVRRQQELVVELTKEEREVARVEAALTEEVEKHYTKVQKDCPLD